VTLRLPVTPAASATTEAIPVVPFAGLGDVRFVGPGTGQDDTEPGRAKVLLVDDHVDMRTYLRKHLAREYEVVEASRADEALRQVAAEIPDVIVCDVMMPGMDGYEFCRAIKADRETDFLPVILVTARGDAVGRITGLEGGADDYITKPFDPAEVLARIRNLLRSRERLKARFAAASPTPNGPGPVSLDPTPLPVASADVTFVAKLRDVLDQQSNDELFDVEALAAGMGMSRAHLHRRIKETLDLPPSEVIIRFRLERAARMLEQQAGNVGEVAYAVGFKNLSHFVKRFRNHYGETPAVYAATRQLPPGAAAASFR
jgi:DNA-binding response OmpR family regulator